MSMMVLISMIGCGGLAVLVVVGLALYFTRSNSDDDPSNYP